MKSRIQIYSNLANLSSVRDFVRTTLREMEILPKISEQVVLAVDEACANAIIHQHNCDGTSFFELVLYRDQDSLCIELKDKGEAFPIDTFNPESLEQRIQNHSRGGMGILLIKSIMDSIEVEQKNEHHIFKFTKNLNP